MEQSDNFLNKRPHENTMVIPQTARHWLTKLTLQIWKYTKFLKVSLDSIFYQVWIYYDSIWSFDEYTRRFWCDLQRRNIRNVWHARGDGYYYDVKSKCCDKFSWVDADVFKNCQASTNTNLSIWDKSKATWSVGITQLVHYLVRCGGQKSRDRGPGIFAPTFSGFLPPHRTSRWVNCAVPITHVVSLWYQAGHLKISSAK